MLTLHQCKVTRKVCICIYDVFFLFFPSLHLEIQQIITITVRRNLVRQDIVREIIRPLTELELV